MSAESGSFERRKNWRSATRKLETRREGHSGKRISAGYFNYKSRHPRALVIFLFHSYTRLCPRLSLNSLLVIPSGHRGTTFQCLEIREDGNSDGRCHGMSVLSGNYNSYFSSSNVVLSRLKNQRYRLTDTNTEVA